MLNTAAGHEHIGSNAMAELYLLCALLVCEYMRPCALYTPIELVLGAQIHFEFFLEPGDGGQLVIVYNKITYIHVVYM